MSHAEGLFETFFQHSINKRLTSSSKKTSSDDDKKLRGKSENSKNIPVNVIVIKVTLSFELAFIFILLSSVLTIRVLIREVLPDCKAL